MESNMNHMPASRQHHHYHNSSAHQVSHSQGSYCDMNYQLHPSMRLDNQQLQPQSHQDPNHNFQQHQSQQQQLQPQQYQFSQTDAARRGLTKNEPVNYRQMGYQQQNRGLIYGQYEPQRAPITSADESNYLFRQDQDAYKMQEQLQPHNPQDQPLSYDGLSYDLNQSPTNCYMQQNQAAMIQPTIHTDPRFDSVLNPVTSQQQQQQQQRYYQYNNLVMQQEEEQSGNYLHYQLPHQVRASQQHAMTETGDKYPSDLLDQNQAYYQQEQMDLHPTIKQQQQMLLQQQQQSLTHIDNVNNCDQIELGISDVRPSPAIMTDPFSAPQMCNQNIINHQILAQHPTAQPVAMNVKPDLETTMHASNYNGCDDRAQSDHLRRPQHQHVQSNTSYISQPNCHQSSHNFHLMTSQQVVNGSNKLMRPITTISSSNKPTSNRRHHREEEFIDLRSSSSLSQDWLDTICRHLIEHMNRFGICVIDNFLGNLKGESILKEVRQLYSCGQYSRGRLVSNKISSSASSTASSSSRVSSNFIQNNGANDETGAIRNDRVIWIDGYEDGCSEINNLIQTLCSVITNSARLSLYSNIGLDKVVINKRTKAHVACYPGNGTRYIKHVDNPNGDGRVITAIYYPNKDWSTKRDGGLLRMFPAGMDEVANIEPLFDRVLFFWSDRRNPHEVLPAYKDRYAITVWYIGENRP